MRWRWSLKIVASVGVVLSSALRCQRITDLEDRLSGHLATATGQPRWQAYLALDDILDGLTTNADHRLAFQNTYPVMI